MNKKILSTIIATALAVSPLAVFAENSDTPILISAPIEETVAAPAFVSATMKVTAVADGSVELADENGGITNLTITDATLIIDTAGNRVDTLNADDTVTYHVNANKPAPLIFPPVYAPDVIVVHAADGNDTAMVKVDNFVIADGALTSADGQLIANIDPTVLENADGSKVTKAALAGKELCVIYSMVTMSIPAQTNPEKVYILPSADEAVAEDATIEAPIEDVVTETTFEITNKISANGGEAFDVTLIEVNGRQMLPVRAVAEALGLEVGYDDYLQSVRVGTTPMGVGFNIGKDSYTKSRMMPITLGQAPIKVIFEEMGVTYVPVEFFTDVLESEITVDNGVTSINLK